MKTWILVLTLVSIGWGAQASAETLAQKRKRGAYLVTIIGCNDCHTPFKMGPEGPAPDMERMLSGHPEALKITAVPKLEMPWVAAFAATNTAFAGPWGVSFAPNLTSDKETGIGSWSEKMFIEAMRTGRHLGKGRPIMPPMPWQGIGRATDADLSAIFAFLQSTPAIRNQAPDLLIP